jgi:hypothetical protein
MSTADLLQPFIIDLLIFWGFSFLGLSSVTKIFLQYLLAILPITILFFLSLSPPHPKTTIISFLNCFFNALKLCFRASGV